MGVMSDREIRDQLSRGLIRIEPLDKQDIQPASIDLHLDLHAKFRPSTAGLIEVGSEDGWQDVEPGWIHGSPRGFGDCPNHREGAYSP